MNELLHTYLKHEACILPAKTGTLFRKTSGGQGEQDREEQRYAINSWWVVKQQPPQKRRKIKPMWATSYLSGIFFSFSLTCKLYLLCILTQYFHIITCFDLCPLPKDFNPSATQHSETKTQISAEGSGPAHTARAGAPEEGSPLVLQLGGCTNLCRCVVVHLSQLLLVL